MKRFLVVIKGNFKGKSRLCDVLKWVELRSNSLRGVSVWKETNGNRFMVSVLRPILSFLFAPEQTESVAHGNATGSTAVAP